ncbi:MAG: GntR family transcriptional regulator [Hungatella sp.]
MNYTTSKGQPANVDTIFESVRKRILKLELEPGQKISENIISEEYGVSRSVIRSVFSRLQQSRLLDIYPQRGTYVTMIDLNYIADLLLLRTAVEKEILSEILDELHGEDLQELIKKLEENLNEQEKLRDLPFYGSEFKKLDSQFHYTMINSVGRHGIVELLTAYMVHIARWRNFDVAFDHRIPALIEEHRRIVAAIKSGSLREAHKAMAAHLETISGINERAKAQYPQYFI